MTRDDIEQAIYERTREFVPENVQQAILELIEQEREECAKLCDEMARQYDISIDPVEELIACETAAAIRARGQA